MNPFLISLTAQSAAAAVEWLGSRRYDKERAGAQRQAAQQWAAQVLDDRSLFTQADVALAEDIISGRTDGIDDILDSPIAVDDAGLPGELADLQFQPGRLVQSGGDRQGRALRRAARWARRARRLDDAAVIMVLLGILVLIITFLGPGSMGIGVIVLLAAVLPAQLSSFSRNRCAKIRADVVGFDVPRFAAARPVHARTVDWANTWLVCVDPADRAGFYPAVARQVERSAALAVQAAALEGAAQQEEQVAGAGWQTPSQQRLVEAVAELELIQVQVSMLARAAYRYRREQDRITAAQDERLATAAAQEQLRMVESVEAVYRESYRRVWTSLEAGSATGGMLEPARVAAGETPHGTPGADLARDLDSIRATARLLPDGLGAPITASADRCWAYGAGIETGLSRLAMLSGPVPAGVERDVDPDTLRRVLQSQNARLAVVQELAERS